MKAMRRYFACWMWFVPLVLRASIFTSENSVQAFYYLWYGNERSDGEYKHWNHEVLPHWEARVNQQYPQIGSRFSAPDNLHSSYYPLLGTYSSAEPAILKRHCELLLHAGVNVIIVSWWGRPYREQSTDSQGVNTDANFALLLNVADEFTGRMTIAIHLEPYPGRDVRSVREDIEYLVREYGHHVSLFRDAQNSRPLFYVYDSYHIPYFEWQRLLSHSGDLTVRGTPLDGIFIGLWLSPSHGSDLSKGGFDGAYSYFAVDGFSYASSSDNWRSMCSFCHVHHMLCVPSVGPGYNDSLIRPWNTHNTRDRGNNGQYYSSMWSKALGADADVITITSFNEWGEGTQIEPAIAYDNGKGRKYLNYNRVLEEQGGVERSEADPYLYLNLTLHFGEQFRHQQLRTQTEEEGVNKDDSEF